MTSPKIEKSSDTTGMAVTASGSVAYDPSRNVLQLVDAAVLRIDDLAKANEALQLERIKNLEILRVADSRRLDDLRAAESRRVDEHAAMRAEYLDKLAVAESKRIDAIRAVDVGAVAIASERTAQQATVLANQVSASADALRTLVATTAATMAAQSQNLTSQFTDRLGLLEKSQYENKGRSGVADPQMERLAQVVERLAAAQSVGTGKSEGISASWAILIGVVALIGALLGLSGRFGSITPAPMAAPLTIAPISAPAPQIMYLPAPITQLPSPPAK